MGGEEIGGLGGGGGGPGGRTPPPPAGRTALPNFYSVNFLPGIMFLSYDNLQIFTETYLAE